MGTENEVDTSRLNSYLDEIMEIIRKARVLISPEETVSPSIRWMIRGGRPAGDEEPFSWCWARVKDSEEVKPECEELVKVIEQSYEGYATLDGFKFSLSPDGRILRRLKV